MLAVLALAQLAAPAAFGAAPGPGPAPTQDPAAVTAAIRQALAATAPADAQITLGTVQGARYMHACAAPLGVTITGTAPYDQAAVHCPSPAWTLYVPVTVVPTTPVVVAARPIAAGQTLAPGDLVLRKEPMTLYAGRQVFYDPSLLTGAEAAMTLPQGTILTSTNIEEPVIVHAGQTVAVEVRSGDVAVSVNAIADQTGRIGETILMTNPSSGKNFPAQVTRSGLVVQLQP